MLVDRNLYRQLLLHLIDLDDWIILVLLENEAIMLQLNPPTSRSLPFEGGHAIFSPNLI
jgi:hypothetical protein